MKPFLITFDVEEFDWPVELGRSLATAVQFETTARGLGCILPLLERRGVRATFFITGTFAQARPDSVRAIVRGGHEVAAHGFDHQDDYGRMDCEAAIGRLRAGREIVERISGREARGIRTPHLLPCAPAVLRAAGFTYDASPHPSWVPGRYNGLSWPRSPWKEDGVLRLPISVLPGLRLPVSFIWYRTAGPHLGRLAAWMASLGTPYLHVYFHPWEATEIRRLGIPSWLALGTGDKFVHALDSLLRWDASRLSPTTVGAYAQQFAME